MGGHWIFCIALACAALGTGQNPSGPLITVGQKPGEHGLTAEQKRLNIQSFEFIWSTIRDQYWDPSFGGVNWIDVHDELGPELERAVTMQQAREVMGQMMGRLGKSHFAIIPNDVYGDVDAGSGEGRGSGTAGLDVRVLDEHALVTTIERSSPAAAQGVHAGWEILAIDGAELAPLLRRLSALYRDSTARELYLARAVMAKLAGEAGRTVQVQFLDGADVRVTKRIERIQPQGSLAHFGYLPPMHVWIKSRKVADNIGYVAFNLFLDPARLMPEFGDAVHSCADCAGVIIDLRGNPGGLGIMAMGMAGWFIEKPDQRLGTMHTRQAPLKFTVNPRLPTYRGPLAILVDGSSGSTSEVFAGGMKDLGRARIFGTRTAGAALPSAIDRLPNGDAFQHALADYISEGGQPLEGVGVAPDVEVRLTRAALLAGRDPVLDAAIEWIHSRK
ncbi:MAG: hypothetical protein DMG58_21985 [Acidobacteria bacterium]|nr:MAG: hypothetical protein DMG58_21985 [Acidobacteriota bacterium]